MVSPRERGLLALCVLAAALAIWPWMAGLPGDAPGPSGDGRTHSATLEQSAPQGLNDPSALDSYARTVTRPLFVASRRRIETSGGEQPGKDGTLLLDQYRVVGVVVAGDRRIVLIRLHDGDKVIRVEQGEAVDGWTFADVSRARLVLEKGGTRREFPLRGNDAN